jgi:hypothetical protein
MAPDELDVPGRRRLDGMPVNIREGRVAYGNVAVFAAGHASCRLEGWSAAPTRAARLPDHLSHGTAMESQPSGPLELELQEVTETLQSALADACASDITGANTGELIRVEEVLAIANEAAKKAVSIRRRRRRDTGDPTTTSRAGRGRASRRPLPEPGATHREFVDAAGRQWDAFAVHPSAEISNRARLPDPYRNGWLSFASGDERRRLSPVPDDWQAMSEEGLRELCERAERVPRRSTSSTPASPPTPPGERPKES